MWKCVKCEEGEGVLMFDVLMNGIIWGMWEVQGGSINT